MGSQDLTGCASAELFDHALTKARVDPVLQSDDYWMYVRALHLRSDRAVFEQAVSLCSGREPLARAVGADVLASEDVRCALAYTLGGRSDDLACGALVALSADEDLDTRNWATFALGTLCERDSPVIREALVSRLSDNEDEVRGEAMFGLAKRRDVRTAGAILTELGREDVLSLAIEAAEEMALSEFLPPLERLLAAHPDDENIQRAVERCRLA